jgi:hypothetical protein
MKKLTCIFILGSFLMPVFALAQEFTDDVLDTPIDGGLSLLVAAGVGYGAKKIAALKKEK